MQREILFLIFFAGVFGLSLVLTRTVKKIAERMEVYDVPDQDRKIHSRPVPKLGGVSLFVSFVIGASVLSILGLTDEIASGRLAGLLIGATILVIGGILDDKYDLRPSRQILFPVAAALVAVVSGNYISYITNPLGGTIVLDQFKILSVPVLGGLLVFAWIMGMTYTTKFLDGMDGLVSGIAVISAMIIFALSLSPEVNQTTTAFLALALAGAALGFLRYNFHPAKIFLGEGGSTLAGFIIGVLSVISGSKIATALLVFGIPILDAAWVIARRLWFGSSPFVGDRKHLHFRLLDVGLRQRTAVLLLYFLAAVFGGAAVLLQSLGKLIALGILAAFMVIFAIGLMVVYQRKHRA